MTGLVWGFLIKTIPDILDKTGTYLPKGTNNHHTFEAGAPTVSAVFQTSPESLPARSDLQFCSLTRR